MYSGLLPKGVTEDDLSTDDEEDKQEDVEEKRENEKASAESLSSVVETQSTHTAGAADDDSPTCSLPGISQEMWQVCCFGVPYTKLSIYSVCCWLATSIVMLTWSVEVKVTVKVTSLTFTMSIVSPALLKLELTAYLKSLMDGFEVC